MEQPKTKEQGSGNRERDTVPDRSEVERMNKERATSAPSEPNSDSDSNE